MTSQRIGYTAMRLPFSAVVLGLFTGAVFLTGCGSTPDGEIDVSGPVVQVAALPAATTNAPRSLPINVTVSDDSVVNTVQASVSPTVAQGSASVNLTSSNGTNWTGSVLLKGNGTFSDIPVTVTVVGTDSQGNATTTTQSTTILAAVPPPASP